MRKRLRVSTGAAIFTSIVVVAVLSSPMTRVDAAQGRGAPSAPKTPREAALVDVSGY
jgi:hypothetical protein